jgi:threonylcarbamoyladenosine tRNA methylthiotransferase MtaB
MADTPHIDVINFGCRLNALEGDQVRQAAEMAGLKNTAIINSCAVTEEAVRQARQTIRRAKREQPDRAIFVTGCAVHTDPQQFSEMPEVSRLIGNLEKSDPQSYSAGAAAHVVGDIMVSKTITSPPHALQPSETQRRARAFVQIQTGCDHRCTFCIIPFGRGNSRSVPRQTIAHQCAELVAAGHKEIVLTGVDITSWGHDLGEDGLGVLIRYLLNSVPDLPRLRLSSVDAVELDEGFLDLVIHEDRLMPHLHLSLQAGDDMILKRMKRRHSRAEAVALCARLKHQRPDITFGADIIAGFPTETEEMFQNSVNLIGDCDLVWLHVFPFSPRPETPAARMPQLPRELIVERARTLREAGQHHQRAWLDAQKGKKFTLLMEKDTIGRAENFARVHVNLAQTTGSLVRATITGHSGSDLVGDVDGPI